MSKIPSIHLAKVVNREKKNKGAKFTVRSLKTGKDFTYRISRSEFKNKWYTHVEVEKGYLNFQRLGTYNAFKGAITHKGQLVESVAANAISYVLRQVTKGKHEWLDTQVDVMHTGACIVCGKELTDAYSIENGIGPVCSK